MTINPFTFWESMWRSSRAVTDTMVKLGETMRATPAVIDSRTRTLAAAARDPLHGDYAEITRMGSEKVIAFSQAGLSAFDDLQAIQAQALANWQLAAGIMLKGRLPTTAEITRAVRQSTAMAERSARAGGKALAPIHRGVTGNARRLSVGKQTADKAKRG